MDDVKRQQLEKRSAVHCEQAFDAWMKTPLVRMAISMIPAGEQKDALSTLLKTAFDSGFSSGRASVSILLIEGIIDQRR